MLNAVIAEVIAEEVREVFRTSIGSQLHDPMLILMLPFAFFSESDPALQRIAFELRSEDHGIP
jgi:hypothetical protein